MSVSVFQLLCEVEWALLSLAIPLPEPVPREIMSPAERNVTDHTNREVRDWGILLKYRDFLHGWADIISNVGRVGRTRQVREGEDPERRRLW